MAVVVFGSINMDLVVRTPNLPIPGQTLTGHTFLTVPGGKGANQAVACARLGVPTLMIGRVGGDVFGSSLLQSLQGYGVDVSGVSTDQAAPSGIALITVDDSAENTIVVVPGANGTIGEPDISRLAERLDTASVLLLQLEVPLEAVAKAARLAHQRGVTVILDPAPSRLLPDDLYPLIDIITPNSTEAAALVGFSVNDAQNAAHAAKVLIERGAKQAIIKMGSQGVFANNRLMPAFQVETVDTVAAGDAFNGGLAAALSAGQPFDSAIAWGLAAGAISVTRIGAQPSMPDRGEVLEMLNRTQ